MKKAALNISLMEIIGLIIGSLVIITLIFFVMGISDLFKSNPEQAMYDNYDVLVSSINDLVNGQEGDSLTEFSDKKIEKEFEIISAEKNAVQVMIPLYIQNGFGVLFFDREKIGHTCPKGGSPVLLNKPKSCAALPCICLTKISVPLLIAEKELIDCRALTNVNFISATSESLYNFGGVHGLGVPGNDAVLRSWCYEDKLFGVKNIKMIRLPSDVKDKYNLLFHITN